MEIYITSSVDEWWEHADELAELSRFVLREEGAPDDCEVSMALVGADEIERLNTQYRGKASPTDVLSFPLDDPWDEGFEGEVRAIGDIVIAPEIAQANADERGGSYHDELLLLTVHGTLHLLGYDHEADEDALEMEDREADLLSAWATESR